MAYGTGSVGLTVENGIATVRFDNVARHNAVSLDMWRQLHARIDEIESSESIRAVLFEGAGSAAFVAGADLSEFEAKRRTLDDVAHYEAVSHDGLARVRALSKPTIAAIQGHCIGAGVAIAVSCDIRIAADTARFAIPAAKVGLGYAWTELKALIDVVGPAFAKDLLLTARTIGADEAVSRGLVSLCCPAEMLPMESRAMADRLAANAPLTMAAAKLVIAQLTRSDGAFDRTLCEAATARCHASEDYREGLAAFAEERRKPRFSGV
jgi:enoyl-CoA hydratase